MSRIGKQPVKIPEGVEITIKKDLVKAKGPKGELTREVSSSIQIEKIGGEIILKRNSDSKKDRALHGLERSLVNNIVTGVKSGFNKKLIIEGVGYKAQLEGKGIVLNIGYSHPIKYSPPVGINLIVNKNEITIEGIDKEKVGQVAAIIRKYKKPEPYKGKGIRYSDEYIKKKAGKTAGGK